MIKKNTTKDAVKSVTATYQNSVITIHYNEEYKVVHKISGGGGIF